MAENKYNGFSTRAIHAGEETDRRAGSTGDVVVPLHLSTTFIWDEPGRAHSEFEYIRSSNPTRNAYERKLAALEDAKYAVAFASGLAAENALMQAVLRPGDHVVAFDDLYGGTRRLLEEVFQGLEVSYVDLSDDEEFDRAVKPNTRLLWIESPTNPMIKVCDIAALARKARTKGILTVVDNTFLSPYFQRPLALGADVVVHSSTKYIGGHSDVLGGALVTSDEGLHEKIRSIQNNAGAVLSPFDSYLNIRGLKTLAVRMERHQQNALRIAQFLSAHPRVARVLYPGLPDNPYHQVVKRQATGFGGMLSFELEGSLEDAKAFISHLRLFSLAESLGGMESLIELPSLMTHVGVDPEVRRAIGISDTLLRVSVGLEDADDLIDDLKYALGD
ncbi:MAG: PLP-dependent aspartate aminotransferase family protein [Rikenellaceae bacterium]|nr:PLP-dependent aspartate aminotransferase family protein [Rikenellaceae bacterium]